MMPCLQIPIINLNMPRSNIRVGHRNFLPHLPMYYRVLKCNTIGPRRLLYSGMEKRWRHSRVNESAYGERERDREFSPSPHSSHGSQSQLRRKFPNSRDKQENTGCRTTNIEKKSLEKTKRCYVGDLHVTESEKGIFFSKTRENEVLLVKIGL